MTAGDDQAAKPTLASGKRERWLVKNSREWGKQNPLQRTLRDGLRPEEFQAGKKTNKPGAAGVAGGAATDGRDKDILQKKL